MSSFAVQSSLTIRSSVYIILIWDPYIFDLYNLWQTWCNYMRRKTNQYALHFNEQITRRHFFLFQPSIRPVVPARVILLRKGPPKLCIECHLVPLWAFPQNHRDVQNQNSKCSETNFYSACKLQRTLRTDYLIHSRYSCSQQSNIRQARHSGLLELLRFSYLVGHNRIKN